MRTKKSIIDDINNLLNEDLTEQFNEQESLSEFGDISITNSKDEQVNIQSFIFNMDVHYIITNYKLLLQRD